MSTLEWKRDEKYAKVLQDVKTIDEVKQVLEAIMSENERLHDRMIQIEDLLSRLNDLMESFNEKTTAN